ncbi:17279_t:CDS:1, partial [Acaulospora colombiana]
KDEASKIGRTLIWDKNEFMEDSLYNYKENKDLLDEKSIESTGERKRDGPRIIHGYE